MAEDEKKTTEPNEEEMMTWVEHLSELRRRLIKCLLAITLGTIVCAYYIEPIIQFLTAPVEKLYFMKPAEAFFIYFKVAIVSGAVVASPVLFYEFWAFLVPAFTRREKRALAIYVPISLFFFLLGIAFSFSVVLPRGLQFFMTFSSASVQPLLSLESYLDFVIFLVLPFGFVFNLPLALILLAQAGLVTSKGLKKIRKYVIFLTFVAAAIITPTTDVISQSLLAVPMILLYEGSIFFIRVFMRK